MGAIATKKDFAAELGVSAGRLAQYIKAEKIGGAALVGSGVRARIDVQVAREQLRKSVGGLRDAKAKIHAGNLPGSDSPAPRASARETSSGPQRSLEDHLKLQRLKQLKLSNESASLEAAVLAGKYVGADAARQACGRIAGQLMAVFESSIVEFSNAIAGSSDLSSRDASRLLKSVWRTIRARQAKSARGNAEVLDKLTGGA